MNVKPYIYIEELAEVTPWSIDAIRAMVRRGKLRLGEHYFQEGHRSRLTFKWEAIVRLIESGVDGRKGEPGDLAPEPVEAGVRVLDVEKATAGLHRLLNHPA